MRGCGAGRPPSGEWWPPNSTGNRARTARFQPNRSRTAASCAEVIAALPPLGSDTIERLRWRRGRGRGERLRWSLCGEGLCRIKRSNHGRRHHLRAIHELRPDAGGAVQGHRPQRLGAPEGKPQIGAGCDLVDELARRATSAINSITTSLFPTARLGCVQAGLPSTWMARLVTVPAGIFQPFLLATTRSLWSSLLVTMPTEAPVVGCKS